MIGLCNTQIILERYLLQILFTQVWVIHLDNKSVQLNVCGSEAEGWDIFWGTCAK